MLADEALEEGGNDQHVAASRASLTASRPARRSAARRVSAPGKSTARPRRRSARRRDRRRAEHLGRAVDREPGEQLEADAAIVHRGRTSRRSSGRCRRREGSWAGRRRRARRAQTQSSYCARKVTAAKAPSIAGEARGSLVDAASSCRGCWRCPRPPAMSAGTKVLYQVGSATKSWYADQHAERERQQRPRGSANAGAAYRLRERPTKEAPDESAQTSPAGLDAR